MKVTELSQNQLDYLKDDYFYGDGNADLAKYVSSDEEEWDI